MASELSAMEEILSALSSPHPVERAALKTGLPEIPGLYAWWITDPGELPDVPLVTRPDGLSLIYVGIAKSGPSANSTLRSRAHGKHIRGSLANSTLRRSLAALLWEKQGWTPLWATDRVVLSKVENKQLSEWIARNLKVAWFAHPEPWTVEAPVIAQMQPPLNVMSNQNHQFYPRIRAARARLEAVARGDAEPLTASKLDSLPMPVLAGVLTPMPALSTLLTPRQYEMQVDSTYVRRGYQTDLQRGVGDWGVDLFAEKGEERIAIQVKMYGGTSRPVTRAMVMELEGARRFFDCTGAALVTNGRVLPDARRVAEKLGISIEHLEATAASESTARELDFDQIWTRHIMPLQGKTLQMGGNRTNRILKVDWSGVERETDGSDGGKLIRIEIFRWVVEHLLSKGPLSREQINDEYPGRASSGIARILSEVPFFEYSGRPATLQYRPQSQ